MKPNYVSSKALYERGGGVIMVIKKKTLVSADQHFSVLYYKFFFKIIRRLDIRYK